MSETEETAEDKSEERKTSRLTAAEWKECETLYELGKAKIADLAMRFGVTPSAISQHFKKNKIVYGSRADEVAEIVTKTVKESTEKTTRRFAEKQSERAEEAKERAYQISAALRAILSKTLLDFAKSGGTTALPDLRNIRVAQQIAAINRREIYDILGVEQQVDNDDLPVLPLQDLSQDEIDKMNEENDEFGLEDAVDESEINEVIEEIEGAKEAGGT